MSSLISLHPESPEPSPELPVDQTGRLTPSGRHRLAQAREQGYLLTQQGEDLGPIDAVWAAWCAAARQARVTVFRYRGVDQPARQAVRWCFLDLAAVELTLLACGRRLSPAGIAAVGRALEGSGLAAELPWSMAPQRVSIGRVPVGADEVLARALVRIGATALLTVPEPVNSSDSPVP
jgi:predicted alpha/beta hydrolase